jgi:hypothetical protein
MLEKFDAFISYSHKDSKLAEKMSQRLRRYRPPRRSGLSKKLKIFRDVERLTAGASLDNLLVEQIKNSRHLVLLASPDSKNSKYVNREVETFLADHDASLIRIVLVKGELHEGLPKQLLEMPSEPLYIDLREADRKQFRLETLRLIASLYRVDYAELRREDEARSRQQLSFLIAGFFALIFFIASGYLIATTPTIAWKLVPQPVTKTWSSTLMPVEQVAVQRSDPNVVVWLGRNALFGAWLDREGSYWGLVAYDGISLLYDFNDRAHQVRQDMLGKPLSVLTLTAKDGRGEKLLEIDSEIFVLSDEQNTYFVSKSTLELADGNKISIPLSETTPYQWLDSLEPEPAETLRELGYSGRDLEGLWIDYTEGSSEVDAYFQGDFSTEAGEVLAATASAEYLLFSNDEDLNSELQELVKDEFANDIWHWDFVEDSAKKWMIPTQPQTSTSFYNRDEIETADSGTDDGPELNAALLKSLGDLLPVESFYRVTTLERPTIAGAIIEPLSDREDIVQNPTPILLVSLREGEWQLLSLPTPIERIKITDVIRSEEVPSLMFAITDRAGIFRSGDFGKTWEDASFGEAAFRQALETKLIIAPGPTVYALALLSDEPGKDLNPLFRLEERNWIMRWRIGLAAILSGESID